MSSETVPEIVILVISIAVFIPEIIFVYKLFNQKLSEARMVSLTLRINLFIFVTGVLILGFAALYDVFYLKYKAPMPYSQWQSIQWSDFRGIKRPKQTLDGEQHFAFICSNIEVAYNSGNAVTVTSYFHPCRSYTFSEESAGKNLLAHELYHFHITEYFARQIREKFAKFETVDKAAMNAEADALIGEEREAQYRYDDETYHGYVLGKQRKWQSDIDSCLKATQLYADPEIKFKK